MNQERNNILEEMGEQFAKFALTSQPKDFLDSVQLYITIYRFKNPLYFIMNVQNGKNKKGDDTIQQRLSQLPVPLKVNEIDIKKIKSVF